MVAVRARLFGMKHSHPVLASRMALELAGIPFAAHDLLPGLHGIVVRARGFQAWTVPALELDGRKIQGSLAIACELDRIAPWAELFPNLDFRCVHSTLFSGFADHAGGKL